MKKTAILAVFIFAAGNISAETPKIAISLNKAQKLSLAYWPALKAAKAKTKALKEISDAGLASLRPQFFFEGDFKRISNVSKINLSFAGGKTIKLGDNENYSVGPAFNWLLYDFGSTKFNYKKLRHLYLSQKNETAVLKKNILLSVRLAYLDLKLAFEKAVLIKKSLNLADAQYNDIKLRYEAGAADKLDKISADQEVLIRKKRFREAVSQTALAFKKFSYATGWGKGLDFNFPADEKLAEVLFNWDEKPTLIVKLDSLEKLKKSFGADSLKAPDKRNPSVRVFEELKKAAKSDKKFVKAEKLPKFNLFAKSSLDYPNGPVLETFNQNIVGLNFKMSLSDGGGVKQMAKAKNSDIKYARYKKSEFLDKLRFKWDNAKIRLKELKAQSVINSRAAKNSEELARLTYDSYKAGRATFLKVEDANLKALNWKIESVENQIRILTQLALMKNLSAEKK